MANGMKVTNDKFWAFKADAGPRRWWRFAQVVELKPDSIDDSEPAVELRLINMHAPSSARRDRFYDPRIERTQVFKNELRAPVKAEYFSKCLERAGQERTILAGDTNIKTELELVTLTTRDARGQWGVQANHLRADDFIIFRGFRGRIPTRRSTRTCQEYFLQSHCPVWVTLTQEAMEKPLYGRDAKELADGKAAVIARVTDPNLPHKGRMTAERANMHFDVVLASLAMQDQHSKAMSQQIEAQFLAEAKQETAAVDAGAVGSSGDRKSVV